MTASPSRPSGADSARLPPAGLPGLDPRWSRLVEVPDRTGHRHTWHLLDTHAGTSGVDPGPVGTLLCVHGNPTWSYLWRHLLAAAPPGWRVVAPDQLGMGWSDRLEAPRTFAERVEDLGDLTTALALTGPVVTVGHDWGGAISLGWALAHRDVLRGVVLGNTAVALGADDAGPAVIRLASLPALRDTACVRTPTFVRATTALSRPALPRAVRDAFAAPYRTAARRRAVGSFVADIPFRPDHPSAEAVAEVAEGVRGLDVPALLFWGPRDPVFGERYLADLRQRLPQADLHRYERASHLVTEDAPASAAAVARWVADLDGPVAQSPPAPTVSAPAPASAPAAPAARLWSALAARAHETSPAVVEVGGATVDWATLARRVDDTAAGLVASGLRSGDRVGLLVPPSVDLTVALYAVWRAGGVVVVADKGLGLAGMRRALRSAAVQHVVGSAEGLAAARVMGLPGRPVAATGIPDRVRRALGAEHDLASLEALGRTADRAAEPSVDADCAVVFTSGATGPAKGVVYRQRQVLAQLDLLRRAFGITAEDRFVAAFAPFALLGPALGIGSAVPAIDVTAPQTLTAPLLADAVEAIGATIVFAAPAALRRVAATAEEVPPSRREGLRGVRLLISAGAPVPAALLRQVREVLPDADPHTPYGMTEALPVTDVSLAQVEEAGPGDGICVGWPLPGVDVALSPLTGSGEADGALTDQPGVTGEVAVRAPHVKDRYDALWATERASSRDPGWHRTGDVGHLDDAGRLWVEGRLVHVVTTPAGPVTPVGVEQRVEALGEVHAAAAVGVGPPGTQAVVVVVVPETRAHRRAHRRRRPGSGRPGSGRPGRGHAPGRPPTMEPADLGLVDAVRAVAGVEVAAVLTTPALPVDIRHASKVDRQEVARRAARTLAGSSRHTRSRAGT
ncbi:MAG TPA: alpha/beta fold hydrolase [Dermatophilaceae bacterium]|nr:alpha/beta fold hydrolase [Dermatophilaceae bacterium]